MSFEELEKKWPKRFQPSDLREDMSKWTRQAKNCFELSANCSKCEVNTGYGMSAPSCYMPRIVSSLLGMGKTYPIAKSH
jgi:hypothetical protein